MVEQPVGKPRARKPLWRRLRIRPAYLVLLAVMGLFAYKFIEKTQEIHSLSGQETALRWQNQQTAEQNSRLQHDLQYYRTPQYIEEQARAIFGDTYPGEGLVQSQPVYRRPIVTVQPAPPRPASPPAPTWQQWWQAFFGK